MKFNLLLFVVWLYGAFSIFYGALGYASFGLIGVYLCFLFFSLGFLTGLFIFNLLYNKKGGQK